MLSRSSSVSTSAQSSASAPGGASGPAVQLHPFYVVVRIRQMMDRETTVAAERFPRRRDTGFRSVRPLLLAPDAATGNGAELQQQAALSRRVGVVDPDGAYDASSRHDRVYEFDRVFDERASNMEVYTAAVAPLVGAVRRGMNATCFAYGMTGAGKTYTMSGDPKQRVRGICSLAAEDLFAPPSADPSSAPSTAAADAGGMGDTIQTVHVSYLEIYNERLRDLLVEGSEESASEAATRRHAARFPTNTTSGSLPHTPKRPTTLDVVEDPERGVFVTGLSEIRVTSVGQLEILMAEGAARRVMASTGSNQASSRSHAILQITVRRHTGTHNRIIIGRLQLIDLAGSERAVAKGSFGYGYLYEAPMFGMGSAAAKENAKQTQLRTEGANINRSLLALGACITALGNAAAAASSNNNTGRGGGGPQHGSAALSHVPYRDSKLTRLLKESLGGNTRTAMVAAVSPSCLCYEETLSTLKYASKARLITRTVRRNTVDASAASSEYTALIAGLEDEVKGLRAQVEFSRAAVNAKLGFPLISASPHHARSPRCDGDTTQIAVASSPPHPQPSLTAAKIRLADLKAQFTLLQCGGAQDGVHPHRSVSTISAGAPVHAESQPTTRAGSHVSHTSVSSHTQRSVSREFGEYEYFVIGGAGAPKRQHASPPEQQRTASRGATEDDSASPRQRCAGTDEYASPSRRIREMWARTLAGRKETFPNDRGLDDVHVPLSLRERKQSLELLRAKVADHRHLLDEKTEPPKAPAARQPYRPTGVLGERDRNGTAAAHHNQQDIDRPFTAPSCPPQRSQPSRETKDYCHQGVVVDAKPLIPRSLFAAAGHRAVSSYGSGDSSPPEDPQEILRRLVASRYAEAFP
jgi:hypothetical protein